MADLVEVDPSQYLKRSETFHLENIPVGSAIYVQQLIHELVDIDQIMAIYGVDFELHMNTMEINTSVVISINPEFMRVGRGAYASEPHCNSNNVIVGFRGDMLSTNAFHAQPAYQQQFNPPRALASNFRVIAQKYGGSTTPDAYVTIWYRVFKIDDFIEKHMVRRFYG